MICSLYYFQGKDNMISYKQLITYDQKLGFKFVPNLDVTIPGDPENELYSYKIRTDPYGFRNDGYLDIKTSKKPIYIDNLFLGCSFTAGDGVSNQHRFSDLMGGSFYNAAISGSCMVQQVLAGIECSNYFNVKNIFFMPYLGCILRNLEKTRELPLYGARHRWNKPQVSLKNNILMIENQPIPKPYLLFDKNELISSKRKKEPSYIKNLKNIIRGMPAATNEWGAEYKQGSQIEMLVSLLRYLKKKFKDSSLIIAPIPTSSYLEYAYKKINRNIHTFFSTISEDIDAEYLDISQVICKESFTNYFYKEGHTNKIGHLRLSKLMQRY